MSLSVGCFLQFTFITVLSLLYDFYIILFPHLLSMNHKCTYPYYFPCYSNGCLEDEEKIEL
jgi:hypothetical protein